MQTIDITDMRTRPPHRLDVLANAVFGDFSPALFRPGKYYTKGSIVYTYNEKTGDIDVWKCQKSGMYDNAIKPGWEIWSLDDVRMRMIEIENLLKSNYDIYNTRSYNQSYYLHDVGIRDWERRGSFAEVFNGRKYLPKKNYQIINERIEPITNGTLPDEKKATVFLSKANNDISNLVRRIELEGRQISRGRVKIPFPADEKLMHSYIFDLFIDGVYIDEHFINIITNEEGVKCVDINFNPDYGYEYYVEKINAGLLTFVPPVAITDNSEFIFVFYISISHDLMITKTDVTTLIGDTRDTKFIEIDPMLITDKYQETIVYNNGIRMRETEYTVAKDRITADNPDNRFVLGAFSTISVRTFNPVEEEAVTNVKQETVPMFGLNTGVLAIPFLNYDSKSDHFLLFNDGGVLMGTQRWFEDNGYVNLYDDSTELQPNEMAEFRMISRDKNMYVTTYMIPVLTDEQMTFELPTVLRKHYFHMIFTENGQFFSRTKYAISGNLLQVRTKYTKRFKAGERLELICFDYASEYGFTSLSTFTSAWDKNYTELELDNLPHEDNDELDPVDPGIPDEPDIDINDLQYDPITNPTAKRLTYATDPKDPPGSRWIRVQDTSRDVLAVRNKDTWGSPSFITGVDCDNQIIVSTSSGDIVRYNRNGIEDTRYTLIGCCPNGIIKWTETDDFGCTYFNSYDMIGKVHLSGQNPIWCRTVEDIEVEDGICIARGNVSRDTIKDIVYINGWLYVCFTPNNETSWTVGRIDAHDENPTSGKMFDISIQLDAAKAAAKAEFLQAYSSNVSKKASKIFIGSTGQRIYEFTLSGTFSKFYGLNDEFNYGIITRVLSDGKYVYATGYREDLSSSSNTHVSYLLRYDVNDHLNPIVKEFPEYGEDALKMALDSDGNCYVFDPYGSQIIKLSKQTFETVWVYTSDDFVNGSETTPSEGANLFVDPVDYHVYLYYYSNNNADKYRYLELEQNDLPLPKYRHKVINNGVESATIYQPSASPRDLSWRMSKILDSNRYYVCGKDTGNIFTLTQTSRELTKREADGSLRINGFLWIPETEDIPVFIVPDDDYNYYVIKQGVIVKYNRYDRVKWKFDRPDLVANITERFVFNHMTKDFVFFYYDTSGNQGLGKIDPNGDFTQLSFTLPNDVCVENSLCAINVDYAGSYYFAYSTKTVYRYKKDFTWFSNYGINTKEMVGEPAGSVVITGNGSVTGVYVSGKDNPNGDRNSLIVKMSQDGRIAWEHNFLNTSLNAFMAIDKDDYVYMCDDREIRKIDEYGNYIWRFKYEAEGVHTEPTHIIIDDFYRIYFIDDNNKSIHRIDQYDLTLDPVPDEPKEPTEPKVEEPDNPAPENYVKVQRTFDIPFDYDDTTSSMMLFTNTGQYIGNRFWEIQRGKIRLKGAPVYENGWLDIIRIRNERESVAVERS